MHRIHGGFTAAFPIKEEETTASSLSGTLAFLHNNSGPGAANFGQSQTTLFLSGVVLPGQFYNEKKRLPPTFVLATTYCGPLKAHLYDLIATNKNILLKLLMFCKDFNGGYNTTDDEIYSFIKKNSYRSNFNSTCSFISKQETQNEKALRKEIEDYIDRAQAQGAFNYSSSKQVKKCIQRHIIACGEKFEWALKPSKKNFRELLETVRVQVVRVLLIITGIALVFALLAPVVLSIAALFGADVDLALCLLGCIPVLFIIGVILNLQRIKTQTATKPPDNRLRALAATQLNPVLNEMTATAPLKKGFLRPFLYAATLRVLGLIAPVLLRIPTVSSIRWLVIDKRKRLLFLSCFSNTTDFYVRDFLVGNTARGVNFMFSNGEGFPDTLFFFKQGVLKDPEGYMHAVHTGQQVTALWYAHEKNLTADVINKNRKIRNGLFKRMTEEDAWEWLQLL